MKRGFFITLEGIDGAGKSTHLHRLAELLTERGHHVLVTREPGGTELGESIRRLVLDAQRAMTAETEALLMFASRKEHLTEVIVPALAQGKAVLCDRFTDATFAYQGSGRGVGRERLLALEDWIQQGLQPDLTLLFDIPVETARERLQQARAADRFESERTEFYQRVRQGYLERARQNAQRFRIVDSSRPIAEVDKTIAESILGYCNK